MEPVDNLTWSCMATLSELGREGEGRAGGRREEREGEEKGEWRGRERGEWEVGKGREEREGGEGRVGESKGRTKKKRARRMNNVLM